MMGTELLEEEIRKEPLGETGWTVHSVRDGLSRARVLWPEQELSRHELTKLLFTHDHISPEAAISEAEKIVRKDSVLLELLDAADDYKLAEYLIENYGAFSEQWYALQIMMAKSTAAKMGKDSWFNIGRYWSEWKLKRDFEAYARSGARQRQFQEKGLPAAVQARKEHGRLVREVIIVSAKELYAGDPALRENFSETARRIERMELEELKKSKGGYIGWDRIARHLSAAKNNGDLDEN